MPQVVPFQTKAQAAYGSPLNQFLRRAFAQASAQPNRDRYLLW